MCAVLPCPPSGSAGGRICREVIGEGTAPMRKGKHWSARCRRTRVKPAWDAVSGHETGVEMGARLVRGGKRECMNDTDVSTRHGRSRRDVVRCSGCEREGPVRCCGGWVESCG